MMVEPGFDIGCRCLRDADQTVGPAGNSGEPCLKQVRNPGLCMVRIAQGDDVVHHKVY